MPELPEVQTIVDDLRAAGLPGARIVDARVSWPRSVGGDAGAFSRTVAGRRVAGLDRRGKFILVDLDGGLHLVVHLRMSGRLFLVSPDHPPTGYERVVLQLDTPTGARELRFHNPRKWGRMLATENPAEHLRRLGVEPLGPSFTAGTLAAALRGRRRAIKPLLLEQSIVAGLGNIYTDEALWEAEIHPLEPAGSLDPERTAALVGAIRRVLKRGIRNLGTSLGHGTSNFVFPGRTAQARNQEELQVFQRTGLPCPRCGDAVVRIVVAQRATHLCPTCQVLTDAAVATPRRSRQSG